jgi:hypothetical protein
MRDFAAAMQAVEAQAARRRNVDPARVEEAAELLVQMWPLLAGFGISETDPAYAYHFPQAALNAVCAPRAAETRRARQARAIEERLNNKAARKQDARWDAGRGERAPATGNRVVRRLRRNYAQSAAARSRRHPGRGTAAQ